jgi:hypothetical protein
VHAGGLPGVVASALLSDAPLYCVLCSLQGAELAQVEQGVRALLERGLAQHRTPGRPDGVRGAVSGPEGGAGAGHVTVTLQCEPRKEVGRVCA